MADVSPSETLLLVDTNPPNPALSAWFAGFGVTIVHTPHPNREDYHAADALLVALPLFTAFGTLPPDVDIPVIVLADTDARGLCVETLERGADDFLIYPINPRELHARINAIRRRISKAHEAQRRHGEVLSFATFHLYPERQLVIDGENRPLALSAGEFELLHLFARHPQRVLGREFLLQMTRDCDLEPFDRRIDVQVSRLRQKLETNPQHPILLKTIRNQGYLFTPDVYSEPV